MSYVYDFKGRAYKLLGTCLQFTYLECNKTSARIKVANEHYTNCGFRPA